MTQSDEKKPDSMWVLLVISGSIVLGIMIPVLIDMVEDLIHLIF